MSRCIRIRILEGSHHGCHIRRIDGDGFQFLTLIKSILSYGIKLYAERSLFKFRAVFERSGSDFLQCPGQTDALQIDTA